MVENGARRITFKFPEVEGLPKKLVFGKQIFGLKKGRSVVPHGHNNMATAFLILKGNLRGRHYDRLEDQKDHVIIRPTIDREFETGGCSTVSDYKDNVHWFQAITEPAYIFNIHVLNVRPESQLPNRSHLSQPGRRKISGWTDPCSANRIQRIARTVRLKPSQIINTTWLVWESWKILLSCTRGGSSMNSYRAYITRNQKRHFIYHKKQIANVILLDEWMAIVENDPTLTPNFASRENRNVVYWTGSKEPLVFNSYCGHITHTHPVPTRHRKDA